MRCRCCNRPRPVDIPTIGIQYGKDNRPALILWNCPCKTTRTIKWAEATEGERKDALNVELSRHSRSEMHMGEG